MVFSDGFFYAAAAVRYRQLLSWMFSFSAVAPKDRVAFQPWFTTQSLKCTPLPPPPLHLGHGTKKAKKEVSDPGCKVVQTQTRTGLHAG